MEEGLRPGGATEYLLYVGTFTVRMSAGIYAYRFDSRSGEVTSLGCVAEAINPSSLALDPRGRYLYTVANISDFQNHRTGGVKAFAIDRQNAKLTPLNELSSGGPRPCHIEIDKTGKHVFVSNYEGGSIAVLPVLGDGHLADRSAHVQHYGSSVNRERQEGPHPHAVGVSPDGRFAIAADLGLDQLIVYRFDSTDGSLEANNPPFVKLAPGSGPRHLAFHPSGRFVYAICEMGSIVTAFSYDTAGGVLRELQTISMLPDGFVTYNEAAEIEVHPAGRFLYASNRGHDSIAAFSIDSKNGMLTLIDFFSTLGKTPRTFAIDPTASYLIAANEDSDNMVVFHIDVKTGRLTPTGRELPVPTPACVKFVAFA